MTDLHKRWWYKPLHNLQGWENAGQDQHCDTFELKSLFKSELVFVSLFSKSTLSFQKKFSNLAFSSDLPFATGSDPVRVWRRSFRARRRLFTGGISDLPGKDDDIDLQDENPPSVVGHPGEAPARGELDEVGVGGDRQLAFRQWCSLPRVVVLRLRMLRNHRHSHDHLQDQNQRVWQLFCCHVSRCSGWESFKTV